MPFAGSRTRISAPSPLRRRLLVLPAAVLAAGLVTTAAASSAIADPTPSAAEPTTAAAATADLQALAVQNEQLAEKYDAAVLDVSAKQQAATAARTAATTAAAAWKASLVRYGSTLTEQFKSTSLDRAGALLTSDGTQDYLDSIRDLDTLSGHNAAVLTKLDAARSGAQTAQKNAADALTAATKVRDDVASQKKALTDKQAHYQQLVASLTAAQRAAYLAKETPTAAAVAAAPALAAPAPAAAAAPSAGVHAGSAAAQTAIDFALAQRGKPYVFGAGGPNAFDCSGLTAAAYAAAGVRLPHSAAGQYGYGTHVPLSQLQPGDLVFYYSPIGHVGIYLGNGLMVHAPTSGDVVKVSPMFAGAVGATRLT